MGDFFFKGHSDTETILALYEVMGEKMLKYLIGMWAFGIWDTQEKKLFISRDRYGQKPLYWAKTTNAFFVSSEIKLILEFLPNVAPNKLAISEYLGMGNYGHLFDKTFFKDIHNFLPATYCFISSPSFEIVEKPYWVIEEVPYKDRVPFDDQKCKEFRELVFSAVESQLISDVSVGATLSGGLDSSIIVSCIAALGKKNFPVFTAQFPGEVNDETKYVKAIEKKFGNALEMIYTEAEDLSLKESLEKTIIQQEEPFGDTSIIAHGFLVRAARKMNIPVILGGQGGDEVSMGYSWMYERLFAYAFHNHDFKAFFKFNFDNRTDVRTFFRLLLAGSSPNTEFFFRMKARKRMKLKLAYELRDLTADKSFGNVSKFNNTYLESLKTVGIPHLCHYDDRSTMAESIEGRMPFLDHRLIEFVSRLQPTAFYYNGFSKYLFRESFKDLLPVSITERKDKIGFFTPIDKLINKDKIWVKNILVQKNINHLLNDHHLKKILNVLDKNEIGVKNAIDIFRAISVAVWSEKFLR